MESRFCCLHDYSIGESDLLCSNFFLTCRLVAEFEKSRRTRSVISDIAGAHPGLFVTPLVFDCFCVIIDFVALLYLIFDVTILWSSCVIILLMISPFFFV